MKIVLALLFVFNFSLLADELRIVDSHGLTRAQSVINGKANVEVELAKESEQLVLVNPDGVAADLNPNKLSDKKFIFQAVMPGTWKLKSPVAVQAVKIVNTK